MVRAVFQRRGGRITAFTITGHAHRGPHGQDIVCAAVSALAQATVIGLTDVVGVGLDAEQKSGLLQCSLPATLEPRHEAGVAVLLETLLLSLRSLAQDYNDALQVREISHGGGMDELH